MRIIDFFLSFILIVITIPIGIVVIVILIFSQEKIFYYSSRIGKLGKKFDLIKFNTIKKKNRNPTKEEFNIFGKFLRRSSIDELPQLLNVILGQMSLVGPRPLPKIIENKIPIKLRNKRRSVLPGITGYSQLNYKGKKRSLLKKVQDDLFFIDNQNLVNYFKIICITPFYILIKYKKNKSGYSL